MQMAANKLQYLDEASLPVSLLNIAALTIKAGNKDKLGITLHISPQNMCGDP